MSSDPQPVPPVPGALPVRQIGPHHAVVDGSIIIMWFVGDFMPEHWPPFAALIEETIAAHGFAYAIGHLQQAGAVTAAVRKEAAKWLPQVRLLGFANVQANPLVRAIAVMMSNAIRLVTGISLQSGFFEDEQKARAWIAQLEKRRREQAANSHGN